MSEYVGVEINGIDTYHRWGFILLADLNIGQPPIRENLIEIPGKDGYINASYLISDGEPVYGNREITFTLFSRDTSEIFFEKISLLSALCHGRECNLRLPTDNHHYYRGLFKVDGISGYHDGKIPIQVTAQPYALKNELTEVSALIPESGNITLILYNEMKRVVPKITVSNPVTVEFQGNQYSIEGTTEIPSIKLNSGYNNIKISGQPGSVIKITYQEARL